MTMEKNNHVSRCTVVSPIKNGHFSAIAMLVFGDGTYPETHPCHNDPFGCSILGLLPGGNS